MICETALLNRLPSAAAAAASPPRIVIVGGGLAGLATAVRLATARVPATLLESKTTLGGRAGSFADPVTGDTVDNCQHVSMSCCTNLSHFCRTVGIDGLLAKERELFFIDESGSVSVVRNSRLPAPLHQMPSFLRLKFLSAGDKLRIAWAISRMFREPAVQPGVAVLDWLKARRQTSRTIDRYWSVVLVSALNESLDRIDYRYARQVFVEGFFANRQAATVEIPRVPLSEFYGAKLQKWLEGNGISVQLNSAAAGVNYTEDRVRSIRLRNGTTIEAEHVVLALPFQRVLDFIPEPWRTQPPFAFIAQLQPSPIISVHVWFDRPTMDWPHLVVVGRTIQWLFRRDEQSTGYVQAVISAARELAKLDRNAIERMVVDEIRAIVPKARGASVHHVRIVTEKFATYSVVPGIDELRPDAQTPIANLWLAGDYVRTGWPATMEGAIRSGYLAADALLRRLGSLSQNLEPALPPARLSRLAIKRALC